MCVDTTNKILAKKVKEKYVKNDTIYCYKTFKRYPNGLHPPYHGGPFKIGETYTYRRGTPGFHGCITKVGARKCGCSYGPMYRVKLEGIRYINYDYGDHVTITAKKMTILKRVHDKI